MHYFFKNSHTLHSFLRNLTECTRVGGYFVGTCYNGQRVFKLLENKKKGESVLLEKNGKKIFEIGRQYSNQIDTFPENEESIGMPITVYQESIDNTFEEYLVNFTYFTRLMEDYGFVSLTPSEYQSIGYPESNGSFEGMYRKMMQEIRKNASSDYKSASEMSKEEMTISFLNQYFIYKKVRHITPEMMRLLNKKYVVDTEEMRGTEEKDTEEMREIEEISEIKEKTPPKKKTYIRKLKGKTIVLRDELFSPMEKEEKKIPVFGEYQMYYDKLPEDTKKKFDLYPREKQMEILKKIKPKPKIVPV